MSHAVREELRRKRLAPDDAAALVRSGDWLDYGFGLGQPDLFDHALAARVPSLSGVKLRAALALRRCAAVEADPHGEHLHYHSWYFSGIERKLHDRGLCHHIPMNFGETPDYYRRFCHVDVAVLKTAPMDENGFFNFGPSVSYHKAVADGARTVIVETNASVPYVHGVDAAVHISRVAGVIDGGEGHLPELTNPPPSDIDLKVAGHIVPEIGDGACIQIGIGGMANTVAEMLAAAPVKDLGVHTEMFVDSLVTLHNAGKVTGARKTTDRFKMTYTFAAGSKAMYRFLDRNPDCVARPVDQTNLPQNILRNDNVVSICNAAMIDLTGQVCAESAGVRHISGTGGQLQFVRGAYASAGGKSFVCFSSTREHHGRRTSRIVPELDAHTTVSTPRTDVMFVVTEYGMVNLKGKSIPERARALISIAHPDFREGLERTARECRLIPQAVF
ncbi:MAG TPA: acetyl-CoA hydrolase/transferase C-terminal domain-containing protein [Humisphaera sp.]